MSKVSIALLDPFVMFRKGLIELIKQYEHYVIIYDVDTFEELVNHLKSKPLPDILLLEVEMSIKNGFDVSLWMDEHYPSVKVVAISSIHTDYAISKMIATGVCGYISKKEWPTTLQHILQKLENPDYTPGGVKGLLIKKMLPSSFTSTKQYLAIEISDQEVVFLQLCCTGLTYKAMAVEMEISAKNVEKLSEKLLIKLDVRNRSELAVFAVDNGLRTFLPLAFSNAVEKVA